MRRRTTLMPLSDVEHWPKWFIDGRCQVRLFRFELAAIAELKRNIDPVFWDDVFVRGRYSGLVQYGGQHVLVQVHECTGESSLPTGRTRSFLGVVIRPASSGWPATTSAIVSRIY